MANTALNYDVLLHLMAIQASESKSEIVPMMQTCRALQDGGASLLLRDGVRINRTLELISFYRFMCANETRFRFLRKLSINLHRLLLPGLRQQEASDSFTSLLAKSEFLVELSIHHSRALDGNSAASEAIAGLTRLEKLLLCTGECWDAASLRHLFADSKSRLRVLAVDFLNSWRQKNRGDPVDAFNGLAQHLERLHVGSAAFQRANAAVQYPRLKYLTSTYGTVMEACLPLIQSFPNLAGLEVPESDYIDEEPETYRKVNLEAQRKLRWQGLSYLKGSLSELYGLAVQCPVETLEVLIPHYQINQKARLAALVYDSTPIHLKLEFRTKFQFSDLGHIFGDCGSRLDSLVIDANVCERLQCLSPHELFESLLAALGKSKLTYVRLTLDWRGPPPLGVAGAEFDEDEGFAFPRVPSSAQSGPLLPTSQHLDPVICARRIVDNVASIRKLILRWRFEASDVSFSAEVDDEGGVRSMHIEHDSRVMQNEVEGSWYTDLPDFDLNVNW